MDLLRFIGASFTTNEEVWVRPRLVVHAHSWVAEDSRVRCQLRVREARDEVTSTLSEFVVKEANVSYDMLSPQANRQYWGRPGKSN